MNFEERASTLAALSREQLESALLAVHDALYLAVDDDGNLVLDTDTEREWDVETLDDVAHAMNAHCGL